MSLFRAALAVLFVMLALPVYGAHGLHQYVDFSERAALFDSDFEAIPPDAWVDDATALTTTYLAELEAITPEVCYADRYVIELYATRALLDFLTAPPEQDAYGASALTLHFWLSDHLAPEVSTTC